MLCSCSVAFLDVADVVVSFFAVQDSDVTSQRKGGGRLQGKGSGV